METKSIGIIGYGKFGSFIHNIIKKHLFEIREVKIYDKNKSASHTFEECCGCDIVIPCVPISQFEKVIQQIQKTKNPGIIMDICTVKQHTENILKKSTLEYVCTHPMFGPQSYNKKQSLHGCRIVVCESSLKQEKQEKIKQLLRGIGLQVVKMSANEHDKELASTLFLTHYISQIVYESGFDRTDIDTLSFGSLMDAVESVAEDKSLFLEVWEYNSHCKEILKKFQKTQIDLNMELY